MPTNNSSAENVGEQPGTSFLNPSTVLANTQDTNWLENNIPLIEVPTADNAISQVYYYRWQTYHEHLVYTSPEYGYLSSEFLHPVGYGAPYGGVNAAAGHHINEGKWLRNTQYDKDIINYWLSGPGVFPKANNDYLGTGVDWAHEYAFWAASAVWNFYLVTGDGNFAISQLNNLISQYQKWSNLYDTSVGMYYITPVWEASEYTPSSYELDPSDPYHGGLSYRPLINSVMYGEARAIANIAQLAGNSAIQTQYTALATQLQSSLVKQMWDSSRNFFYPIGKGGSTQGTKVTSRELSGYAPWAFYLAPVGDDAAWAPLLNSTTGFGAAYGPRTTERNSPWYWADAGYCCHWDGPQWPYITAVALTGLANYLDYQKVSPVITSNDYVNTFMQYTMSQFKNGKPYVAEAHDPDLNQWDYDTANHSEDYNHSTYNDNVISGLFGIRAQPDNTVVIQPLIPESWPYFIIENVPYHGHNLTVLWDQDGTRYYQGAGLHVYVDGKQVAQQAHLTPKLQVNVGSAILPTNTNNLVDVAVNSQNVAYLTQVTATYPGFTSGGDNVANVVSGIVYRVGIPENNRWTSYGSTNSSDTLNLSFTYPVSIKQIVINFYDDSSINGALRVPDNFYLCTTSPCTADNQIPGQMPGSIGPNSSTIINLTSPVITSNLYLSAANSPAPWGVSRIQVMSNPSFVIRNVNSNLALGSSDTGSPMIVQQSSSDLADTRWILQAVPGGWFKIINANTGMLLTVPNGNSQLSLNMQMQSDINSDSQLWRVMDYNANGQFRIFNKASNLLLGVAGMSTSVGSNVVQFSDSGTADHLWQIIPAASIMDQLQPIGNLANKTVNIINFNSKKAINYNPMFVPTLSQLAVAPNNVGEQFQIIPVDNNWFYLKSNYTNTYAQTTSNLDSANINLGNISQYIPYYSQWGLLVAGNGQYKIINRGSKLLMAVDDMGTDDSSFIQQYEDNGTADHLWSVQVVSQ